MNTDEAVHALYETFPYPRAMRDLDRFVRGERVPTWNPAGNFHLYFPEEKERTDLEILVAGCGTNAASLLAAAMPGAHIVGIDISAASLELCARHNDEHGIENVELRQLAVEDAARLGREFDLVHCHGVLHHLADPVAGLRALGAVTRPGGALSIMVYALYGRTGVYMLQDACRLLGLGLDRGSGAAAQAMLMALPEEHPFRMVHANREQRLCIEEVMDMLLHPRDVAFTVPEVRTLVDNAGLRFHRWLGQALYAPAVSPLLGLGLAPRIAELDSWQRATLMELYYGALIKHEMILTRPERTDAETLFDGERIFDAIPHLAQGMRVRLEEGAVVLSHDGHQLPIEMRGAVADLVPKLKAIDGRRNVLDLLRSLDRRVADSSMGLLYGAETYRRLYLADLINLEASPPAG